MATISRPKQDRRLAGRERKSTILTTTTDITTIETISRHHDLAPDDSPWRDNGCHRTGPRDPDAIFLSAHPRTSRHWIPRLRNASRESLTDKSSRRLHCNRTMADLETRENRCGGLRHAKPAGGFKSSKGGPPVPAPANQEKAPSPKARGRTTPQIGGREKPRVRTRGRSTM